MLDELGSWTLADSAWRVPYDSYSRAAAAVLLLVSELVTKVSGARRPRPMNR
jgi:hypothetical protein